LQGVSPLFSGYADSLEAVWATAKVVDLKPPRDQSKRLSERSSGSYGEFAGAGGERGGLRRGGPHPASETEGQ
jgi:hypothetical protein